MHARRSIVGTVAACLTLALLGAPAQVAAQQPSPHTQDA